MVLNCGEKANKTCASFDPLAAKLNSSKSSVKSKIPDERAISKKPKCSATKISSRIRSKTSDEIIIKEQAETSNVKSKSVEDLRKIESHEKNNKSETCIEKKECKMEEEKDKNDKPTSGPEKPKTPNLPMEAQKDGSNIHKRTLVYSKPSETFSRLKKDVNSTVARKVVKLKETQIKKPSEIPKLVYISETCSKKQSKINMTASKLPIRTIHKDLDRKPIEPPVDLFKTKPDLIKISPKPSKTKKLLKDEEKLKEAMKNSFSQLVPYYQKELKKITDVWVNSIYSSMTLRTNLIKLLFQAFPSIDRSQFHTEDEKLLYCIAHAKNCTKSEAESLIQFMKSLIASQEKAKEDYGIMTQNKEIAQNYNYDWRELTRKIAALGEETKQLQIETPELIKKRQELETAGKEKIQKLQFNLNKKDEEIQKLVHQLELLKHRENSYKGNIFLKVEDYKDIKADVVSLISVKKEYEELKAKHMYQNDIYEKKIKDLEILLDEKKKILDKESAVKKQLQTFLSQLQAQQNRLSTAIGKEQLDFVMTRPTHGREKRREQLWVTAIKLVIKGFLIQIKKLERDRNKMLLELQSNDTENFRAVANIIIQKDNFIKSVKHQMKAYHKTITCSNVNRQETSCKE